MFYYIENVIFYFLSHFIKKYPYNKNYKGKKDM